MTYECHVGPNGRVCPLQDTRKIKRVLGKGVAGSPLGTQIQEDCNPWLQLPWFPGNIHNSYHNSNQAYDVMASKYDILLKAIKKKKQMTWLATIT